MEEHIALHVDDFQKPKATEISPSGRASSSYASSHSSSSISSFHSAIREKNLQINIDNEEQPLIQSAECRICQEEDTTKNLDIPCACTGSLKHAHRSCLQRWINEKGDLNCEICRQPYKSGYTAPARTIQDETAIDISGWAISGTPFDLHDPRLLAMAAAQRHFLEAEFDEYTARTSGRSSFCRSVALILMALFFLRHAVSIKDGEGEDDGSAFFFVFLLRAASFLLPCYVMAWAISILQRLRESQEDPELTSADDMAFILPPGQARGMQYAISPEQPATPQREPRRL